jgi:tRNA uridine 5-carboxymethylaminomethyl modification enzyme
MEVKVVEFPHKSFHPVFREQQGFGTGEVYVQGTSNSLPEHVQLRMLRSIPGLQRTEIMRPGYAVEYDFVPPTQLRPSLDARELAGLFCARQINGTSAYQQAAAQGIIAGSNATRALSRQGAIVLQRSEACPMLTSRCQFRLMLSQANADQHLTPLAFPIALVQGPGLPHLVRNLPPVARASRTHQAHAFLPRPPRLFASDHTTQTQLHTTTLDPSVRIQVAMRRRYAGYVPPDRVQAQRVRRMAAARIPPRLDYQAIRGLSTEGRMKLAQRRPESLHEALRIPGLTLADLGTLQFALCHRPIHCGSSV